MDATNSPADVPARSAAARWIWLAVAAALLAGYFAIIQTQRPRDVGIKGPAIGRSLAYLGLEPLTGDARHVSADDLAGHVTLVNFWGTWCPPCIREFPHLVELAEHFGRRDEFRFYPVSCGGAGDDAQLDMLRSDTEAFLRARHVELPTYADQNATSRRALVALLGLDGFAYPTTLVLDQDGKIRGFWVGYESSYVSEMTALVEQLLDERTAQSGVYRRPLRATIAIRR